MALKANIQSENENIFMFMILKCFNYDFWLVVFSIKCSVAKMLCIATFLYYCLLLYN